MVSTTTTQITIGSIPFSSRAGRNLGQFENLYRKKQAIIIIDSVILSFCSFQQKIGHTNLGRRRMELNLFKGLVERTSKEHCRKAMLKMQQNVGPKFEVLTGVMWSLSGAGAIIPAYATHATSEDLKLIGYSLIPQTVAPQNRSSRSWCHILGMFAEHLQGLYICVSSF